MAVYSLKGGVGKTTLAVNLAWASATLSSRRTLLWDLDGQAAATWILGQEKAEVASVWCDAWSLGTADEPENKITAGGGGTFRSFVSKMSTTMRTLDGRVDFAGIIA